MYLLSVVVKKVYRPGIVSVICDDERDALEATYGT